MRALSFRPFAYGALAIALASCAHMEPPSGGPVDEIPPAVLAVYPAPGSRNVAVDAPVVFQFTEWIDRNVARTQAFISPPPRGKLSVIADGDKLQVRPSEASGGFRKNTSYQITVLSSLKDLHGVSMGRAFTLRFSTGPSVDIGGMSGSAVRAEGSGTLMAALYQGGDRSGVEAYSLRDTGPRPGALPEPWRELPAFLAAVDSFGDFAFDSVSQGEYSLLVFEDVNANFAFDLGFERAAVGELSLGLRPRPAGETVLRVVAVDTVPLSAKEIVFKAEAPADSAGRVAGRIGLTFIRPPQPTLAAMPSRYRVISDSGESLPVLSAGWDPSEKAWILETAPLKAGGLYRIETTGRPDFPGRADPARKDTSFAFEASAAAVDSSEWKLTFTSPMASTGLAQIAGLVPSAAEYRVAGNKTLTPSRLRALQTRLEARADSLTLPAQITKVDAVTFSLKLSAAPPAGKNLSLHLLPGEADSSASDLLATKVADSGGTAGVRFTPPEKWKGWTFWLKAGASETEYPLVGGAALVTGKAPPGGYSLFAFRDHDGDGVWNPGSLRPWKAQEPYVQALDTLSLGAGEQADLTERFAPVNSRER